MYQTAIQGKLQVTTMDPSSPTIMTTTQKTRNVRRRVSFHDRVNVRVMSYQEERSDQQIRDEKKMLWYSEQELGRIKKSYCQLVVSLDKQHSTITAAEDDMHLDHSRVIYALQSVKSREMRKERITLCRLSVLYAQECQWTNENEDVEAIASASRESSAASLQDAQTRGDLVALSMVFGDDGPAIAENGRLSSYDASSHNKTTKVLRRLKSRATCYLSRQKQQLQLQSPKTQTLLRPPSPMPRPRRGKQDSLELVVLGSIRTALHTT
jgi:hypothetical protein